MKLFFKKSLCGLFAFTLAVSLIGCGKKETPKTPDQPTTNNGGSTSNQGEVNKDTEEAGVDLSKQDPVTLEVYALTFQSTEPGSTKNIENALNEHIEPILNTKVHLNIIPYASYGQQLTLLLSGSEQADLIMGTASIVTNYVAAGGVVQLDDAIANYGEGIVDALGEHVLDASKVNDSLFAIPTNRDFASAYGFMYNKDLNERYDLGLENATDFEGLAKAFEKLHVAAPEITCVQMNATAPAFSSWSWDSLGNQFGVLMDRGATLNVENLFASEEYKGIIDQMRTWYQLGYINQDALTTTVPANDLMAEEKVLGYFVNYNPAVSYFSASYKVPMGMSILVEPFIGSVSYLGASWLVGRNTVDVDRAIQFMNLMYSDQKVYNLLTYGVEGEDYAFVDKEQGIIDYPEGVTAENSTVEHSNWMWGNEFIGYVWNGDNPDIWESVREYNASGFVSKATGFNFDPSNVQNEIAACTNVVGKYRIGLEIGAVDPEEVLPQFLKELEQNGINAIVEEKQQQLNDWAQKKGIQ